MNRFMRAGIIAGGMSISLLASGPSKIVTAAQVNGTWTFRSHDRGGKFKVLALGKQRLKVQYSGWYSYQSQSGPTANTNELDGVAFIDGDTAVLKPEEAGEACKLTLHFEQGKLVVTQEGDCGSVNVVANGTYSKTDSRKPAFD